MSMADVKIIEGLSDRYSYGQYLAVCKDQGIDPLTVSVFACMSGRVGVALVMHYGMPIEEAYAKLVQDEINDTPRQAFTTTDIGINKLAERYTEANTTRPCNGCGGGKVL